MAAEANLWKNCFFI